MCFVYLLREERRVLRMAEAGRHLLLMLVKSPAADSRRRSPKHRFKLLSRPRLLSSLFLPLQETWRLQPSRGRSALAGRWQLEGCPVQLLLSHATEGGEFPENFFHLEGAREHNPDLEVWRGSSNILELRGSTGKQPRRWAFRCKRCLGLLSRWLRTVMTPKPGASSQQTPKCRAVCRPRRQALPVMQHPVPSVELLSPIERIAQYFPAKVLHRASDCPGSSPPDRADSPGPPGSPQALPPQDLHPVGFLSPPSQALCRTVALPRLWGVPLGFPAQPPAPERTAIPGPPNRGGADPSGLVGSQSFCKWHLVCPEPANLLRNFMSRRESTHSARTHLHTHNHTFTHTHTLPRIRLHTSRIARD